MLSVNGCDVCLLIKNIILCHRAKNKVLLRLLGSAGTFFFLWGGGLVVWRHVDVDEAVNSRAGGGEYLTFITRDRLEVMNPSPFPSAGWCHFRVC